MPTPELEWALADLARRDDSYELYGNYYEGEHRLLFATRKFRATFGNLFNAFADNLCAPVVDAVADELQVAAWQGPLAERAEALWQQNRMRRRAGDVHLVALHRADSFVMVWPDASRRVRFWHQEPDVIAVRYSEEVPDELELAVKVWRQRSGHWRATVYWPDRLERFITAGVEEARPTEAGKFVGITSAAHGLELELAEEEPNPWGQVPVFHFANNAAPGKYGTSELRDVVPLQDALNKAVADMLVAMEFQALPQRWATGLELEVDPLTGKPLEGTGPEVGPGKVWTVGAVDARMGQFEPASLEPFLKVQDSFRLEIARISGTPLHYFQLGSGQPVAGVALQLLEGRHVKKVNDRALAFGETWAQAVELGLRMDGAGAAAGTASAGDLEVVWEPAGTQDEASEVAVQEGKKRLGLPWQRTMTELGYTDEEIADMQAEKEANAEQFAAGALASFDRGGQPAPFGQAAP